MYSKSNCLRISPIVQRVLRVRVILLLTIFRCCISRGSGTLHAKRQRRKQARATGIPKCTGEGALISGTLQFGPPAPGGQMHFETLNSPCVEICGWVVLSGVGAGRPTPYKLKCGPRRRFALFEGWFRQASRCWWMMGMLHTT